MSPCGTWYISTHKQRVAAGSSVNNMAVLRRIDSNSTVIYYYCSGPVLVGVVVTQVIVQCSISSSRGRIGTSTVVVWSTRSCCVAVQCMCSYNFA